MGVCSRGGVSALGGCLLLGMSAPGGVCLLWGVSALEGDVCSEGRCLLLGVSAPGGVCSGGCIQPCTEADTPPVDRHTPVKT